MNAPEYDELFTLPKEVKKVVFEEDSKMLNTVIFTIHLEDHTVGNLLKMILLRDEKIRFAGYRKPHPLENHIELRVTTNGEISPVDSLKEALQNLVFDIDLTTKKFTEQVKNFKMK